MGLNLMTNIDLDYKLLIGAAHPHLLRIRYLAERVEVDAICLVWFFLCDLIFIHVMVDLSRRCLVLLYLIVLIVFIDHHLILRILLFLSFRLVCWIDDLVFKAPIF